MSAKIFLVEGMKCKNCTAHVEREIKQIQGVEDAVADFTSGHVSVKGDQVGEEKIRLAVEKAGYRFKGATKSSPGSDLWVS
ncbi:MAG: heavy-metal-associated domain-containing protein [Prolixibacteraceae bacterium]|jgi:copper chaperone CopZ|nr:heavy-metal-associated domain-containing protein [Prolixibacteraceae bacterium]